MGNISVWGSFLKLRGMWSYDLKFIYINVIVKGLFYWDGL